MFQMLGVFAEFERVIIRKRVNAGLARAIRGCRCLTAAGGSRRALTVIKAHDGSQIS
jgi:hypothetical protein